MPAETRSLGSLFRDLIDHAQDVVRGEVRLVKLELVQDLSAVKTGVSLLIAGGVCATVGLAYLVLAGVFLLSLVMPMWAAALLAAVLMLAVSAVCANAGLAHVRRVRRLPALLRTDEGTIDGQGYQHQAANHG
jgi:hypothetical protein